MGNGKVAKREEMQLVSQEQVQRTMEAYRENLGGEQLDPFSFPRVVIPQGGSVQALMVPSVENPDGEQHKELIGVIAMNQLTRQYWSTPMGEGDSPPDCSSRDAVTGVGDPGGACADCAFAQWGSDPEGGRGQACKTTRNLYLVLPGRVLPVLLQVPPSSLAGAKQYLLGLLDAGLSFWQCWTRFTVTKAQNREGKPYGKLGFGLVRSLDEGEYEWMRSYISAIRESIAE